MSTICPELVFLPQGKKNSGSRITENQMGMEVEHQMDASFVPQPSLKKDPIRIVG